MFSIIKQICIQQTYSADSRWRDVVVAIQLDQSTCKKAKKKTQIINAKQKMAGTQMKRKQVLLRVHKSLFLGLKLVYILSKVSY
jgi:hypothetical protein